MNRTRMATIALAVVGAVIVGRRPLRAQLVDSSRDASLLLRRVVMPPFRDAISIELRKHGQYRVALWPAAARLRVASVAHPEQVDFAPRVREGTAARATMIELYPQEDGAHLLALTVPPGADSAVIWIWESVDAEIAAHERHEHRVTLGVAAESGIETGYEIEETGRPGASPYYEGGALIGNDRHIALMLGAGNDPRPAGLVSVIWFFAELRFGIARASLGGRDLDLAITVRGASGDGSTSAKNPSTYGGGALVTWHLDQHHGAHGWMIGAHATVLAMHGVGVSEQQFGRFGLTLSWAP